MKKKNNQSPTNLSYFGLSLLAYLKENHPLRATDLWFITTRSDAAATVYSHSIKQELTHIEAEELANNELFRGLHFSAYNTLVNILWNEFSQDISEEDAHDVALNLLPLCKDVLAKYTLTDDFDETLQYDMLYTELVGTIQILLEDGTIQ